MERVNFLRENPVLGGMQQAQQMDATRARGELLDMQVEGARERGRQERAASEALNQIWASGGPNLSSADVNRRLAQDPRIGGTRRLESLQTAEQEDVKRTQIEAQAKERGAREFKMLLDTGAYAAAAEAAKRMGMNIPPEFWANKEKVAALRERLDLEDKRAGITQKRAAAGASQALANSRQPAAYDEYTDSEGRLVRVDKATGKSAFVMGPDGQPMRTTSRDTQRVDVARENNAAKIKIAELQARARTETGAARDATMREIAKIQAESREAIALHNKGADLSRTEVQQQGATDRNTYSQDSATNRTQIQQEGATGRNAATNESREAVALGNQGAALSRTEAQQQGANDRNTETNATRESVARGNQGAALDRTQVQQEGADRRAQMRTGGQGGRPLNIEAKRRMLEEAGYPPREAAALAAGGGISPAQRAQISERIRNSVGRMTGRTGMPLTPEEQAAEVRRREEGVFGEQQQPGAPAQAQGAPAAPKDSADIPRGADGKVDHRQLVDGQVYLIPLKKGGQTTGRWNAQTGRFDEVN